MKVNGISIALEKEQSLYDFLTLKDYDLTKIAVECNGNIVPKAEYKNVILKEEDTLEIVKFVGGG
ncbi:sulfur carrier protein ThiS [Bacillus tuaregi]|uniref:sulfur carrier protein ThiS n=1 Tax=Bacillus tuaregi TaxID=1816695 RepID=UPI0008F91FE8|nr:sulfur carrier protein ThiS [Bacillus tuaregi]